MQLQAQQDDRKHVLRSLDIKHERIDVLHVDDDQGLPDLCARFLEKEHDLISIHTEQGVEDALEYLETNEVPLYSRQSTEGVARIPPSRGL